MSVAEVVVASNQKSLADLVDHVLNGSKEKQRKFVESFEVIINCNLVKDEALRGSCLMPNDLGKVLKVAVFIPEENIAKKDAVLKAGADKVGFQDLISEIEAGKINYNVYMASASSMAGLKKIASTLGAKGLMPNAKVGTLTDDIESVVSDMKNKVVFFRSNKTGLVQGRVGTVTMDKEKIIENLIFFVKNIAAQNKNPNTNKGFIKSVYIKSSMGKVYKIENLSELVG